MLFVYTDNGDKKFPCDQNTLEEMCLQANLIFHQ